MRLLPAKTKIDFCSQRKLAAIISTVLVLVAITFIAIKGLAFGIEFTGGMQLEVNYSEAPDLNTVRSTLKSAGFDNASVQYFGTQNDVLIKLRGDNFADKIDLDTQQSATENTEASTETLAENQAKMSDHVFELLKSSAGSEVTRRRAEFVGPQIGEELREQGGLAMLIALGAIFIYIWFRFEWKFSVGAVAALLHDSLIVIGLFAILELDFDLSVLAAVLAVIGYSLNDTIVVSDRIRENFRKMRRASSIDVVNASLNQTLERTLMTSLTTLLVLLALFFLGGELLRGFSSALMIGVIVGTYSSIYVASSVALYLNINRADLLQVEKEGSKTVPDANI